VRDIAPAGVEVIVEVNAPQNLGLDLEVLAMGGTVAIYAGGGAEEPSIPVRAAMGKNARLQFMMTYTTTRAQKAAAVRAVTAAAAAGVLAVGADKGLPLLRFPLEDTAQAHRAVENNAVGKVLIDVAAL
ncbi:MAG: NADPH:quinone reductase, partial [Mycobacterium sp.]|nr:NADPH:quinone reductase [Mycobacterium sp.]